MFDVEGQEINACNRIKCVARGRAALPYAAYLLALSEAHRASGPALA